MPLAVRLNWQGLWEVTPWALCALCAVLSEGKPSSLPLTARSAVSVYCLAQSPVSRTPWRIHEPQTMKCLIWRERRSTGVTRVHLAAVTLGLFPAFAHVFQLPVPTLGFLDGSIILPSPATPSRTKVYTHTNTHTILWLAFHFPRVLFPNRRQKKSDFPVPRNMCSLKR